MKWILPLLALSAIAIAGDITTTTGKVYKNATISRVEPDGLVLMTDDGIEKILFDNLPEEMKTLHGYDPEKAKIWASRSIAAQQALAAQARVDALTQQEKRASMARQQQVDNTLKEIRNAARQAVAEISQGLEAGALCKISIITGEAPATMLRSDTRQFSEPITGFIHGLLGADKEVWAGVLYPAGIYRYTTTMGAAKSVRAFATNPDDALRFYKN